MICGGERWAGEMAGELQRARSVRCGREAGREKTTVAASCVRGPAAVVVADEGEERMEDGRKSWGAGEQLGGMYSDARGWGPASAQEATHASQSARRRRARRTRTRLPLQCPPPPFSLCARPRSPPPRRLLQ